MKHEFKKIQGQNETRYVLESASVGATSTAGGATLSKPLGGVRKRDNILAQEADKTTVPAEKPRNFVAKNAKMGGAGQHRDKKKEQKQGKEKHRKPYMQEADHFSSGSSLDPNWKGSGRPRDDDGIGYTSQNKPEIVSWTFYDVKPGQEDQAQTLNIRKLKSGKWAMPRYNTSGATYNLHNREATKIFGPGKVWIPKNESVKAVEEDKELYGLRVGDTVRAEVNGKTVQGDVIDIFPDSMEVELLLRGANAGRTVTVDVRDTEALSEQGVAENYSTLDLWNMSPKEVMGLLDAKKITYDQFHDYQDLVIQGGPEADDDDFDYTDYSMRKGERGMEEDDGASKEKETEFHSKLDQLVHNTFGKRKGETEGHDNPDHEISMASNELASIVEDAMRLLKLVKRYSEMEGLEAWQQSKITKAADYLNAVLNSLQGDAVFSKEDHSNFGNGWGQGSYDTYAGGRHGRGVAEGLRDPEDNPCWKGYKPVGTKKKGGRTVPNCVPKESVAEAMSPQQQHDFDRMRAGAMSRQEYDAKWRKKRKSDDEVIYGKRKGVAEGLSDTQKKIEDTILKLEQRLKFAKTPEQWDNIKNRIERLQAGLNRSKQGVAEGASDYVGNAIEDLRASKPGLDRESFLDELYSYIDAEYGKQAADAAFAREDDAMFDEWYASYTDMAEAAPKGWEKTVKAMKKHDEIDNPWALAHWMKSKGYKSHKEDAYMAELAAKIAEKLDPNADVDVWVQDFQKADPNRYHQFRNKTPEKKAQMATAARYAAKNPSKK